MFSKQTSIITDCLDQLAVVPYLDTLDEQNALCQHIIDTLSDYPKPRHKGEHLTKPEPIEELGAYLYVSNARNACKLAKLGYHTSITVGLDIVKEELISALSIVTNSKA